MGLIVCQAVGCGARRRSDQFMCLPHWQALPQPLRAQINRLWREWRSAKGEARSDLWIDYLEARDEARRWTAEGEGRLAQFEPDAPRIRGLRSRMEQGDG